MKMPDQFNVDPDREQKEEFQKRGHAVNLASQIIISLCHSNSGIIKEQSPESLFQFAIGIADQFHLYLIAPVMPGKSRLV